MVPGGEFLTNQFIPWGKHALSQRAKLAGTPLYRGLIMVKISNVTNYISTIFSD
jgi:hypothetical protein